MSYRWMCVGDDPTRMGFGPITEAGFLERETAGIKHEPDGMWWWWTTGSDMYAGTCSSRELAMEEVKRFLDIEQDVG